MVSFGSHRNLEGAEVMPEKGRMAEGLPLLAGPVGYEILRVYWENNYVLARSFRPP
jgi:hypothetical protein